MLLYTHTTTSTATRRTEYAVYDESLAIRCFMALDSGGTSRHHHRIVSSQIALRLYGVFGARRAHLLRNVLGAGIVTWSRPPFIKTFTTKLAHTKLYLYNILYVPHRICANMLHICIVY